ncbi:MAG TPA: M24 family metallopeptidase [Chlamydiales bacterium]|nr:M24 family metallopeptidase [Chlamydiales bacterium]
MKKKIEEAQKYLKEMGADGWLLYDFHRSNTLAHTFLEIPHSQILKRRFFYWIPAHGEPVKVVHAIEPHVLDHCPGTKRTYDSWESLQKEVAAALKGAKRVAMEYSPKNAIPYISRVDAGTVEFVHSLGIEVVSSGDFLPKFTAVMDEKQAQSHIRAANELDQIAKDTWKWIADHLKRDKPLTEYSVQQKILSDFQRLHLFTEEPPIASVNEHTAEPHYVPQAHGSSPIQKGDLILLDIWAKEKKDWAVYGDITKVAVAAEKPTAKQQEIFQIVHKAQQTATELVKSRFAQKKRVEGWEVDEAARSVIREAGYGKYFIHRTGHNIDIELHGSGAHMDNLESHDQRVILPGTCFSIEPGIYLPDEFGIRLEYDLYVHKDGTVEITGGVQDKVVCLLP